MDDHVTTLVEFGRLWGPVVGFAFFITWQAKWFITVIKSRDDEHRVFMKTFFDEREKTGTYRMQTGMEHLDRLSDAIKALADTTNLLSASMRRHDEDAQRRHQEILDVLRAK